MKHILLCKKIWLIQTLLKTHDFVYKIMCMLCVELDYMEKD